MVNLLQFLPRGLPHLSDHADLRSIAKTQDREYTRIVSLS
jgi:hypothetical protein